VSSVASGVFVGPKMRRVADYRRGEVEADRQAGATWNTVFRRK
jgi:hypothetical protein